MKKRKSDKGGPHPRPFNCCEMPVIDPCPHSFCIVERARKAGQIPERPKGLPWSTGLLKALPGTGPKYIPYRFPETTDKDAKPGRACPPRTEKEKTKAIVEVCEQMKFFLKIIMMANEVLDGDEKEVAATPLAEPPPPPPQPAPTEAPPDAPPPE